MDAKEEAKELHAKLTSDLNEQFGLFEADRYEQLVNRLKAKLSPKVRKEAKHIMDILEALERNGTISPGNYQYLKNVINEYDVRVVADFIEPTERDIQRILSRGQETSGRSTASGSTCYNNQEMDAKEEAKELHAKLTSDLNEQFGLFEADRYEQLVNRLKAKLSPKVRKEAKHIMDILEALERNSTISPGNYQYLKNVINEYDVRVVADFIEPTERDIQRILSRGQGTSGRSTASGSTSYNNQGQHSADGDGKLTKKRKLEEVVTENVPRSNPDTENSSQIQTTVQSTKVRFRLQAGERVFPNANKGATGTANSPEFTNEEINFAKMGMIALNILADVLYDLLKPDKPNLRQRSDSDITYLYSEHRKLNKHVPTNGWGGICKVDQVTGIVTGDDIERIRLTRNELQHSMTFKLDETRFNELRIIICDLLKRFDHYNKPTKLYTDVLKDILAKTISDDDVKSVKNGLPEMTVELEIEQHFNVPMQ